MTSDPKAPGAAAVYLNIEESTNDEVHFRSYYARIKVLTEKGKELATIEIPYYSTDSKITDIKGRTIHSDGTVIPLIVKPEDLLIAKSGGRTRSSTGSSTCPALKSAASSSIATISITTTTYSPRRPGRFSVPTSFTRRTMRSHPYKGFLRGLDNITANLEDEHGNPLNTLICVADSAARRDRQDRRCRPQESRCERIFLPPPMRSGCRPSEPSL